MTDIRVVVCDDQRVVRDGLVMLVGLCEGITVVGAAADGAGAVALVEELAPDVVLMDLRMPVMDGVEATRQITATGGTRVVVLTTFADDESIFPGAACGGRWLSHQGREREEIEAAVRAVHAGQTWLDPVAQARIVNALGEGPVPASSAAPKCLPGRSHAARGRGARPGWCGAVEPRDW